MRYFFLILLLAIVSVVSIAGFRGDVSRRPPIEIFNDMVRQNKVRPQTPSEFFADERSSRILPLGTVAHSPPYEFAGQTNLYQGRPVYPYEDVPINTGRVVGSTNFVEVNPMPISLELVNRGQDRYQIYCAPCHGPAGDGKGITAKYGMAGMANFHDQRLVNMTDGEIFNTMTGGKNNMPAYGAIVPALDRWAIISYIRVLQRSQLATMDDVPQAKRGDLKK